MTTWTKIPKPVNTVETTTPGTPIGLLLALTYATSGTVVIDKWTKIVKAAGTAWTKITKAT